MVKLSKDSLEMLRKTFQSHGCSIQELKVAGLDFMMWPIHTATNLEILKSCEELGAKILYQRNLIGPSLSYFRPYLSGRTRLYEQLLEELHITNYHLKETKLRDVQIDLLSRKIIQNLEKIHSLKELRKIQYLEFPVGYSLASTLVSKFRTTEIPKRIIQAWAKPYFLSYLQGFHDAHYLHKSEGYKAFIVFNGRFPSMRGVADYAKQENLLCITHDIEAHVGRYTFLKDSIHSPESAFEFYNLQKVSEQSKREKQSAHDFYEARFKRDTPALKIFSQAWNEQNSKEQIPKPYIAIFSSSDHEHFSINPKRDFENASTQMEWLLEITSELLKQGYRVAIRFHPNSEISPRLIMDKWENQFKRSSRLHIFPPKSKMNSYTLASNASVVVTTFSTIAAECAYLGIPVISTGYATYDLFIPFDKVTKIRELIPTISSLKSKEASNERKRQLRNGSLEYAKFQQSRFFNFVFLPQVDRPEEIVDDSPKISKIYRELRKMNFLENLLVKALFRIRFRVFSFLYGYEQRFRKRDIEC